MLGCKITLDPTGLCSVCRQETDIRRKRLAWRRGYGSSPPPSAISLQNKKESIWIEPGQILLRSENCTQTTAQGVCKRQISLPSPQSPKLNKKTSSVPSAHLFSVTCAKPHTNRKAEIFSWPHGLRSVRAELGGLEQWPDNIHDLDRPHGRQSGGPGIMLLTWLLKKGTATKR